MVGLLRLAVLYSYGIPTRITCAVRRAVWTCV